MLLGGSSASSKNMRSSPPGTMSKTNLRRRERMSGSARNEQVRARYGFDALFPNRKGETPVQDVEGFLDLTMQVGHDPTGGGAAGSIQ
jgi:hypothetical protein